MRIRQIVGALGVLSIVWPCAAVRGQAIATTYTDSRGNKVEFPLGDASFADAVIAFVPGKPSADDARWSDSKLALAPPNYISEDADERKPTAVALGCGGVLVLHFSDNALVDVRGPDLYVFEVGPDVEAMNLAISTDGEQWTTVGDITGGTAAVDISKVARRGDTYRYVRLTDLKSGCGGGWPGADVDAVGAIGSTLDLSFDASVLFDVDQSILKPEAQKGLSDAAKQLTRFSGAAITVEGHTDNTGAADHNLTLSQSRAESVRAFLLSQPELQGRAIAAKGFGATRPIARNDTQAGRQKNRRVEIVVDLRR